MMSSQAVEFTMAAGHNEQTLLPAINKIKLLFFNDQDHDFTTIQLLINTYSIR